MSREKGRMVRCQNTDAAGVRCHHVAEFIGVPINVTVVYKCEGCQQGNKPFVPRVGRPGQQKQAKR